jgi:hypothetical protein
MKREAWGCPARAPGQAYSTISFKIPKGIRKLTLKKVAAPLAVVAGAVLLPGVGGAVVAGLGAAGKAVAGAVKGTAATVGNVAKAAGSTALSTTSAVAGAATEIGAARKALGQDVADSQAALDYARKQMADQASGNTAGTPPSAPLGANMGVMVVALLGVFLLMRGRK